MTIKIVILGWNFGLRGIVILSNFDNFQSQKYVFELFKSCFGIAQKFFGDLFRPYKTNF